MSERSREPQDINKQNWYYEYQTHLLLVHEVRNDDGTYIRTDSVKIPWRKIETSLARVRSSKRRRAAQ